MDTKMQTLKAYKNSETFNSSSVNETDFLAVYAIRNVTGFEILPEGLRVVDDAAWPRIYAYFIIFAVAAIGNFSELILVARRLRQRKSPVNRLYLHLSIADLIVVFMVAAVEMLWRISIGWYAGNFMCKVIMFFRAFGLYLSSFVVVCISLDRYFAVVHPLRLIDAHRRVKILLNIAWGTAAFCAIPQTITFRQETHPLYPKFHQCATTWYPVLEKANSWLSMIMMYFVPLCMIFFSYGAILISITRNISEPQVAGDSDFLRRNGRPIFQRAKLRTLKVSAMIIIAFVVSWMPYIMISTWYLIDEQSASKLDGNVQDGLFIMAIANSIANPLVYGCNEC